MRWVALSGLMTSALCLGATLGCGSDVTAFPSGGAGGEGGRDGSSTAVGPGGFGGTGGSGMGGSGGGEAACDDFGKPCTGCLASSPQCQDLYCGCLDNPSCAGFWQCAGNCGGDADCLDGCEAAFDQGYADFLKVRNCMGEACSVACGGVEPLGSCFNCWLDDCEAPLEACVDDPDCNAYIDCLGSCSDFACVTGCYAAVADPTLVNGILDCQQDQCSDPGECDGVACQGLGDACTDCAFAAPACNESYCACLSNQTCIGLSQCFNGCAAMDEACIDACELTWSNGYSEYLLMAGCMGDSCSAECGFDGLPICTTCLSEQCEPELEACLGQPACNEYFDCLNACPDNDPGCPSGCYAAAPDKTAVDALGTCLTASCPTECN